MRLILALACLALSPGCTRFYDRSSGRMIAFLFQSDITGCDVNYSDGTTSFRFAKMSNSAPTRAALLGANKIVSTVASAVWLLRWFPAVAQLLS